MAELAYREALRAALDEELARDEAVYIIGEEVAEYNGAYKVTEGLLEKYGARRVVDTPISELGFAAVGVGSAMAGLRPVVEFMTWNFALLAIDQVVNHAAKTLSMSGGHFGCPIVFRGPNGSAGQLGQQHSQAFESIYANVPGLIVVSPSNPADGKGLLKSAIRDDNPVVFMESEQMYGYKGEVPDDEDYLVPLGKARIDVQGDACTVVSFNKMMHPTREAVDALAKDGLQCELIDLRTVRPIDYDTIIQSVKKTNRLVIVEEAWPLASISSELAYSVQRLAFDHLDAPIVRVTTQDTPLPYASTLVDAWLPNVQKITEAIRQVTYTG